MSLSRPSRTPRLRPPVSRRSTACLPPVVRPSPARQLARPAGDDGRSSAHPSWRAPVLQPILASLCVCVGAIPGAKAKINDLNLINSHALLVDAEGQTIMHHLARQKPQERTPRVTIQCDCSWVAWTPQRLNGGTYSSVLAFRSVVVLLPPPQPPLRNAWAFGCLTLSVDPSSFPDVCTYVLGFGSSLSASASRWQFEGSKGCSLPLPFLAQPSSR